MNKRLNDLYTKAKAAILRFKLPFAFAFAAALFQCYGLAGGAGATLFTKPPMLLSAASIIAFFITLSATLFYEEMGIGRWDMMTVFLLIASALGVVLSYFRLEAVDPTKFSIYLSRPFLVLLVATGLMVFYAGAIKRERDFMPHVVNMAMDIAISYLYAFVLFLGLSLLLLGADLLFGAVRYTETMAYLATICFMPVMALFFFVRIPLPGKERERNRGVFFVVDNLFHNILVPVVSIYLILIYVYFGKILLFSELPNTSVVNLILWPMALTVLILFIVDHDRERTMTYYFRKYVPFIALPLIGLMYYAWFLRVGQYGLTENRYMVFAIGIWILFSMVHFIVEKRELHMILAMTLTVVLLVTVFGGPIGAERVAFRSQLRRLDKILLDNRMLKGDEVIPSDQLSGEEKREIQEIVSYLVANHDVSHISYLKGGDSAEVMEEVFGFRPEEGASLGALSVEVNTGAGLDIRGFDRGYYLESYADGEDKREGVTFTRSGGILRIEPDGDRGEGIVIDLKDIREKVRILRETKDELVPSDLAIEGESGSYRYKVYLIKTQFSSREGAIGEGDGLSLYLLLAQV